jgi:hypothetical protein
VPYLERLGGGAPDDDEGRAASGGGGGAWGRGQARGGEQRAEAERVRRHRGPSHDGNADAAARGMAQRWGRESGAVEWKSGKEGRRARDLMREGMARYLSCGAPCARAGASSDTE